MSGEDRILKLRQNGVFVAKNTVEQRFPGFDPFNRVLTELVLYGTTHPARCAQFSESGRTLRHRFLSCRTRWPDDGRLNLPPTPPPRASRSRKERPQGSPLTIVGE